MQRYLRQVILGLVRGAGILRLFQHVHRHRIIIWMVHGVMDERDHSSWKPLRPQLSREKLDEYLRVLSKKYRFISLKDAMEMLRGRKPIQPYSMVLTFDDGYRNNVTNALPILGRHRAPATFFVPTGFLNDPRPFWCDRLDYALQHAHVSGREVRVGSLAVCLDGSSREALRDSFLQFRRAAKKQDLPDHEFLRDMEQLASQLEAEAGHALADIQDDDTWSAVMTWEQVEELAGDENVTFGSHTADHIRLGLVGAEAARAQLIRSKQDIERHTGKPCTCLAYPNGSYSPQVIEWARETGYDCGVTTEKGLNRLGDNCLALRRIHLPLSVCASELLAIACGFSDLCACIKAHGPWGRSVANAPTPMAAPACDRRKLIDPLSG